MHPATRFGLIAALVLGACDGSRGSGRFFLPLCGSCGDVDGVIAVGATIEPSLLWFTTPGQRGCTLTTSAPDVIEVLGSAEPCADARADTIALRGVSNGRATIELGGTPRGIERYTFEVATPVRGAVIHATDPFAQIDPTELSVPIGARFERRVLLWDVRDRPLLTSTAVAWSVEGTALTVEPDGRLVGVALGDATLHGTVDGFDATLLVHVVSTTDHAASGDGLPQSEVCNLFDEDCDGRIDEDPETGPICDGGGGVRGSCTDGVCSPGFCGAPETGACRSGSVDRRSCFWDLATDESACGRCERSCGNELGWWSARCVDRVCVR